MKGTVLYRTEYGAAAFIDRLMDELATYEETGRFPGPITKRLFHGTPGAIAYLTKARYIRSIELWSTHLQRARRRCDDCNRPISVKRGNFAPMLHDRVWDRIARRDEFICDPCVRRRLGRPYCMHDFVVCLWNVQNFRWLDGPRTRFTPAVDFRELPIEAFDLPPDQLCRLVRVIQGISIVFGIPQDLAISIFNRSSIVEMPAGFSMGGLIDAD